MKKNDNKIESLDLFISLAKIENYTDRFDDVMKKNIKKDFKRTLWAIVPYLVCAIIMVAHPNVYTAAAYVVIGIGAMGIQLFRKFKEDFKFGPSLPPNVTEFPEETPESVIAKGISKTPVQDYYTSAYRQYKEKNINEKPIPDGYKEALERQTLKAQIKIATDDERDYLDKNETMIKIGHDIEVYSAAYKLPPLDIDRADWEMFFDYLYEQFTSRDIEQCFSEMMTFITQMTLARALTRNSNSITIFDFIGTLKVLDTRYTLDDGTIDITKKERLQIQKELTSRVHKPKVIPFNPQK